MISPRFGANNSDVRTTTPPPKWVENRMGKIRFPPKWVDDMERIV